MNREPLFSQLPRDLACAIALGIVEHPQVVVNLDAITLHDAAMRPLGTQPNWLAGDDPLDVVTRDYLAARRDAAQASVRRPGQTGWAVTSAAKQRAAAMERLVQARTQGRCLLAERGILTHARQLGLKILDPV